MILNIGQLKTLIKAYYQKYESRLVEPSISVGKLRPSSKLTATGIVHFEIAEEIVNSIGEKVTVRENIGDEVERIVSTMLEQMGYSVSEIKYEGIPGQEASFIGLNVTCEEKSLDEGKKM